MMRYSASLPGDKRLIFVREQSSRVKPWVVLLVVLIGYALVSNT